MNGFLVKAFLIICCLMLYPNISRAALSSQVADGITFVVVNLSQKNFSVLINCEYSIATDMYLKPRLSLISLRAMSDAGSEPSEPGSNSGQYPFSYDTIEPEFIESNNDNAALTANTEKKAEDDSVFGNKIIIGPFNERQLLISSISKISFQLGDYDAEDFLSFKKASSLSSGSGNMSTTANSDNIGVKIGMYDNGQGKSSWTLISQEAASSWNYTGAIGQPYGLSYIANFAVVYVLYDSEQNFSDVIKEFQKIYQPVAIGNVFYPKDILGLLTASRNYWDNLFTARPDGSRSYQKELFPNRVANVTEKRKFFDQGEELVKPSFNATY